MAETRAERVGLGAKLGYGVGDLAGNLVFQPTMLFLLYYFTDVLGIAASAAGLIVLIAKLWDAVIDPVVGAVTDRTHTRWGQKRPYLLFGAGPLGLCLVLLFAAPPLPASWRFGYGLVSFLALCTTFTLVNVPYGALTAAMTLDEHERSQITGFRMFFAIVGALVVAGATRPLVGLFPDEATGFRVTFLIYAVLVVVFTLVTFFSVKELPAPVQAGEHRLRDVADVLLANRPFLLLTAGVVAHESAAGLLSAMVNYYFQYNLREEGFIPVAFLCLFVTAAVAMPLWVMASKRLGKKWTFNLGMSVVLVVLVALYLTPGLSRWVMVVLLVLAGAGLSTQFLCPWAMVADTVEYSQWRTGKRREGVLYGVFLFGMKVAAAVSGFIVGEGLALSGYAAGAEQTGRALVGIRVLMTIAPAALIAVGIAFISCYPLTPAAHRKIVAELEARGAAGQTP